MRTEIINGVKVKKFEKKKDLIDKLGFSEEQANLIIKYQESFPQLLKTTEGFVIDAEALWNELTQPQGRFDKWVNRKMLPLFNENMDYITYAQACPIGNGATRKVTRYILTVETAKHLAMVTGADKKSSEEVREKGRLARSYFILMEKAVREMCRWEDTREPQKKGWVRLRKILTQKFIRMTKGKRPPKELFMYEANMINQCLFGKTAKEVRDFLEAETKNTRNHLKLECNQALAELQILDIGLIEGAEKDFKNRRTLLQGFCDKRYKKLKREFLEQFK